MKNPFGDLWPFAAVMGLVMAFFLMWPCMDLWAMACGPRKTIQGTVADIDVSAGGWMKTDLTTLTFTDGRTITFAFIHNEFQIGKTYEITWYETFRGKEIDNWKEVS